MNERIKELIKQSGIKLNLDPDSNCYEAQVDDDDMEYFAELIVQECANAVRDGSWAGDNYAARVEGVFGINQATITFKDEESAAKPMKCSVCGTTKNVRWVGGCIPFLCDDIDCVPY